MVKKKSTKKPKAPSKRISTQFHNYEIDNAKTINDCFEIAMVDAYDEYEQSGGWFTCLEDIFRECHEVEFLGEIVEFKKFDYQGEAAIVGVIKKKGKTAKVAIESLTWIKPTPLQALWNKACLEYFV